MIRLGFFHAALLLMLASYAYGLGYEDNCETDVKSACFHKKPAFNELRTIDTCNSNYGGFSHSSYTSIEQETQNLIGQHLQASMQYLLLASRFNEWTMDRKGFHTFFTKMSDDAFNEAIALLQHMNLRGGTLNTDFNITMPADTDYKISEMEALSKGLFIEKSIVKKTLLLINSASHSKVNSHHSDGELALYLAELISGNHAPRVKLIASHVNNLGQLIAHGLEKNNDPSYSVYLYDTQFM